LGLTFDELAAFVRTRMDAAARDKVLYDRSGARLNAQLLQGEMNMGAAVLAWIERAQAGVTVAEAEIEDDEDDTEGD
jgi:hypothetical protein